MDEIRDTTIIPALVVVDQIVIQAPDDLEKMKMVPYQEAVDTLIYLSIAS